MVAPASYETDVDPIPVSESSDPNEWIDRALLDAAAPADRLALLRTRAWREGGSASVAPSLVSDAVVALASRFGIQINPGRTAISLVNETLEAEAPGLSNLLRFDPNDRRLYQAAVPDAVLLRHTSHPFYRNQTQKAAISALLTMPPASTLMVSMPTGSGKSLLFQLAALHWRAQSPGACAIIITPTNALADDHKRSLQKIKGLEASTALTGDVVGQAREDIILAFRRGDIPLLLLSPEAALSDTISAALIDAAKPSHEKGLLAARLMAIFVDEAHIIESWGRAFRPDFQRLPALVESLRAFNPGLSTVLLSATLDQPARDVLRGAYQRDNWLELHAGAPRYEFDLVVRRFESPETRDQVLLKTIDRAPRPAIVYTTRVEDTEDLVRALRASGYARVVAFTGETSPADRKTILDDWADNRLDLVVATSAFGLGVDKSNVRSVIHACLPESAARYYQEIGRASRDGRQGFGLCFWTAGLRRDAESDEREARSMALGSWLTIELAQERWEALLAKADLSWDTAGRRRARLFLDAARPALGTRTGKTNRTWNMSLINLMQRAELIEVLAVDEKAVAPVWDVTILDAALLEPNNPALQSVWMRLLGQRDREQSNARDHFDSYRNLMAGQNRECLLRGLFHIVEPESIRTPRCGRCPTCRAAGSPPPHGLTLRGLDKIWPPPTSGARTQTFEPILVAPHDYDLTDGYETLLGRLARLGIEQFIVPNGRGAVSARALLKHPVKLGFVQEVDDWIDPGRRFPAEPTAIMLSEAEHDRAPAWLVQKDVFAAANPTTPLIMVARPDMRVAGRLLQAVASRIAPYNEDQLETFGGDG